MKMQSIPNLQISDQAGQFELARRELSTVTPRGVLWPTINVAIIAVELHLKSLCADDRYDATDDQFVMRVSAKPAQPNHHLCLQLESMRSDVSDALRQAFLRADIGNGRSLDEVLKTFEGVFLWSRYAFSMPPREGFDYNLLMDLSEFLSAFVENMDVRRFALSDG